MPLLFIGIPLLAVIFVNIGPRQWISKMHAFYTALVVATVQMALAVYVGLAVGAGSISSVRFMERLSIDLFSAVTLFTIGLAGAVTVN